MINNDVAVICFISMILSLGVFVLADYTGMSVGVVMLTSGSSYLLLAGLIASVYFRRKCHTAVKK